MSMYLFPFKLKSLGNNALRRKLFIPQIRKFSKYKSACHYSTNENLNKISTKTAENFIPFLQRIDIRRTEARRSIIVQVQSAKSYKELWSYCSTFGAIKSMFHYSVGIDPSHFIIVEFENESIVSSIMNSSNYSEGGSGMPTQSNFMWFKAANNKLKLKDNKNANLSVEFGTDIQLEEEIKVALGNSENVSEQIRKLHELTRLNDVGVRLRFLTALQIENAITGMFPHATAYPFGSSVNGYGKTGCDLDLFLKLSNDKRHDNGRLVFHCKPLNSSERSTTQRHMEVIGDLIHLFLPGCGHVRRILQARVPIIKYHQQLTDVECDVSMSNMSGVHMSDFLYIMGELDDRVRPLVFTIRNWAKTVGITNSAPGRWITNFSLTLLVLAFLQNPPSGKPVIPTLNKLEEQAGKSDKFALEDGTDVSFLRDITKYKQKTKNTDSLERLLMEFFVYYSQFDFDNKAICLNDTVAIAKPEHSAMYIINPLERGLNVSKNVSFEEVLRFKNELKNAAWILESKEPKTANWGLLSIMQGPKVVNMFQKLSTRTKPSRLVEIKSIFDDNENESKSPEKKVKSDQR
ncbi:unnamed protein product [Phyllotreta striolata]|uniref:Poly(A) RNA polymerase, mitochondrial n=1 Tax=Phyllotreta striolata TaxID=444603 RepID=A0A9N9TRM7_PHYSR|nr:unnamed protein product [Phyllotreta striolata]